MSAAREWVVVCPERTLGPLTRGAAERRLAEVEALGACGHTHEIRRAELGSRERPRRAQTLDACKTCGSTDLFGGHFDADGLAVTADGPGVDYLISCSACGTFHLVGTGTS